MEAFGSAPMKNLGGGKAYSKQSFLRMRGVACFLVILHHLSDHIGALWLFQYIGYLPVGFFLFCSGYGLMISLTKKGYLQHLILVRIPGIVLAYLVANAVYLCVRFSTGTLRRGTPLDFMFGGGALVTYSWHIICILYLYGAFWLSQFLFEKRPRVADLTVVLAVLLWIVMMVCCGAEHPHRYNAVICFLGGILAGRKTKFKNALVDSRALIVASVGFLPSFALTVFCGVHNSPIWIQLIFMELSISSFVIVILNAGSWYVSKVTHSVFDGLGKISLEFYMYQGLIMLLLRNPLIQVQNDLLFGTAVVIGSVILAFLMHHIDIWLSTRLEHMALKLGK